MENENTKLEIVDLIPENFPLIMARTGMSEEELQEAYTTGKALRRPRGGNAKMALNLREALRESKERCDPEIYNGGGYEGTEMWFGCETHKVDHRIDLDEPSPFGGAWQVSFSKFKELVEAHWAEVDKAGG